ncbi:unknown [Clostridium sp. CAG:433]|nr:unknown [Clostridium sp. CAG:433]
MKTNINKLKYYELLDFCIKNEDIEKEEKNEIIEKLLSYKNYLDYPKYFAEINWLYTEDRQRFVQSVIDSNDSQTVYAFSALLKYDLDISKSVFELSMLYNSLYSFNNDEYTKSFIDMFFDFFDINSIVSRVCDDKKYSLLMDLWTKYKSYLTDSTKKIVKTISESSSSYYMYKLLCEDIESDDKSLLIKSICNLNDISYICDTIKFMGSNLSGDDIDNIVSSYTRTLNFLIVKSLIQNNVSLSEKNIDLIIDGIFNELNKENIVFFAGKMHDNLTKKQVEKIIDLAVKTNDSELIYNVSKILKDRLDKENVSKVSREMSKQENIYYVYEFLYEFKDKLSKEDKNKLVSKIVNSREMKLIILVAVFIDVKLIEKLFKSKKDLFIFAVGLNVFTIEELKKLKEKLDITEEKPNMKNIPKKYKLKKKDK